MSGTDARCAGWRGVGLIAVTYIYFLIFAQFAFLKRLAELGIADDHLKAVMAAMALGGIALSLLAPRVHRCAQPVLRLRMALFLCGAAAALTLAKLNLTGAIAVSLLIGSGLGLLTVTLVTHLQRWLGEGNHLFKVGLGTGLGYFVCNLPPMFTASPSVQAVAASLLCFLGIAIASHGMLHAEETILNRQLVQSFPRVLSCFTALVWLDSAAFFIIQNTPALKAGTWLGSLHLWSNGTLHLIAALASAWLLRRRGLFFVLSAAFFALAPRVCCCCTQSTQWLHRSSTHWACLSTRWHWWPIPRSLLRPSPRGSAGYRRDGSTPLQDGLARRWASAWDRTSAMYPSHLYSCRV